MFEVCELYYHGEIGVRKSSETTEAGGGYEEYLVLRLGDARTSSCPAGPPRENSRSTKETKHDTLPQSVRPRLHSVRAIPDE